MNKQLLFAAAVLASVALALSWLTSEPDYTIQFVPRDQKASDVQEARHRVDSDPASAMNWADLATAYLDQKMYDLAKGAADRVLQFDSPYRKQARLILASIAQSRHEDLRALAILDEIEKETPGDPEALGLRVTVLSSLGRYPEALKAAYALTEKRGASSSFRLRGLARENVGALDEAERDYVAAIGLEGKAELADAIENRFHLSRFYFHKRELSRARRVLATALKVSEVPKVIGLLGDIQLAEKNFDMARSSFERAHQSDKNPEWLTAQARVEKARGREESFRSLIELAVELLKTEIATAPAAHPAALARALHLSGKPHEIDLAFELIQRELLQRRDVDTLASAVRIALAKGDTAKAKEWTAEISKTGIRRVEFVELEKLTGAEK